ncbi:MAG TPA: hypothetical protein VFZ77_22700 [Acidimicrobiales bacterium]
MTHRSDPHAASRLQHGADDPAQLVTEMRAAVEAAAQQLDEVVDELRAQRSRVDQLESVVDRLLDALDATVLIVDAGGRITGLSRGAAARLDGAAVGKPLPSVLPAPVADPIADALAGDRDGAVPIPGEDEPARVDRLPGGGAVLVLPPR